MWRKCDKKVTFSNIVLNPKPPREPGSARIDDFNFFVGLAYPSKKTYTAQELKSVEEGPLQPFLWHLKQIWCRGDEESFQFVLKWFASTVQKPWIKLQSAIVLKSKPGGGKGIIVNLIANILGRKYVSRPGSLEEITGSNFNSNYFKQCLLMFLDEVFYAGSKKNKKQPQNKDH